MSARSFLFLQGCTSPFFGKLADALRARGHAISRINFNVGDAVYWARRPAWSFRESITALPAFLDEKFHAGKVTDVIMLGDTRPVHVPAHDAALRCGARVHVFEEGYFRPSWLTLERWGINGYSRLPRDPDWFFDVAPHVPDLGDGVNIQNPLWLLALHEALYHLPNIFNPILFPGYHTHRPQVSVSEFSGWSRRYAILPFHKRKDQACVNRLLSKRSNFFVFPLQLDSDSQISVHSPIENMEDAIWQVLHSFANNAPADCRLVLKNHPLDTGLINFSHHVRQLAEHFDISDRVDYLETGHLPDLLASASGMVTVNSTAGTAALGLGCPTIALGTAVYDFAGLTFQGSLDEFWRESCPPDPRLFDAFRKVTLHTTQVNGGFYTNTGMGLAIQNSLDRLVADRSPLEEFL